MTIKRKTAFEVETPAWVFEPLLLAKNIKAFRNALRDAGLNGSVAYSVKTNSAPEVLTTVLKNGGMAEVVSHDEWKLAMLMGYIPSNIVYNGPLKSKETFREALLGGAIVNIECKREIDWLEELASERTDNEHITLKVGVRVNINVSMVSPADAEGRDDNSRFGFNDQTGELATVIERIRSISGVRLAGLHLHRNTHSRRVNFYRSLAALAVDLINKYSLENELEWLDLGGGYYELAPGKPTYAQYMNAIASVLNNRNLNGFRIIVEPGNALVANTFSYICEIIDVKTISDGIRFITTDASRKDIDPFFRRNDYVRDIHFFDRGSERSIIPKQIIGGCTCIEQDRIFCLEESAELYVGDRIVIRNVGAYTLALSPQFIRYTPALYLLSGTRLIKSRNAVTADMLFSLQSPINPDINS